MLHTQTHDCRPALRPFPPPKDAKACRSVLTNTALRAAPAISSGSRVAVSGNDGGRGRRRAATGCRRVEQEEADCRGQPPARARARQQAVQMRGGSGIGQDCMHVRSPCRHACGDVSGCHPIFPSTSTQTRAHTGAHTHRRTRVQARTHVLTCACPGMRKCGYMCAQGCKDASRVTRD